MKKGTLSDYLPTHQSRVIAPNHGFYSVTLRENDGAELVLQELQSQQAKKPRKLPLLHMGWGSFRNLDIVVARGSDAALLCDISLMQIEMWHQALAMILISGKPEEFVKLFCKYIRKHPRPRFPRKNQYSLETWLTRDLSRKSSWLGSLKSFRHIKHLVSNQKIEIVCCDVREANLGGNDISSDRNGLFFKLAQSLREMIVDEFALPDTLYLSNLAWMMKNSDGFFGEKHPQQLLGLPFPGYTALIENIQQIAPLFNCVISAHNLAADSKGDSVLWKTKLFQANSFIRELQSNMQPNPYPLHIQSQ